MEEVNQPPVTLSETHNNFCKNCGAQLTENEYFCHNCGKKIKDQEVPLTVLRQIMIYSVSILLPPTGLWWGIKYLRQNNPKARTVGIIAIVLTVGVLVISYIVVTNFINAYVQQYDSVLQEYQNLGL